MGGGIASEQRGGLLVSARLPQEAHQCGRVRRVREVGVFGGQPGQRGSLRVRARLHQAVQQVGHAHRVAEVGLGGRVTSEQHGGLLRAPAEFLT